MSTKITINNVEYDTQKVPILESIERFSNIRLQDGSIINIKATPQEVTRIEGLFDPNGRPAYIVNSTTVVVVSSSTLSKGE